MDKINKHITLEGVLFLLTIVSFSLPWINMDMLVKVVGWDLAHVQQYISELTKSPTNFSPYIYAMYLLPFLALVGLINSILLKQKIARTMLAISGIIGLILSILLILFVPNVGSGVFTLCAVSLLSIIVSFYEIFRR